jgi:L-fuculose-phosphate aldolase
MDVYDAKKLVVKAGIKLVESGLIARTWGNVSCRIGENSFVITPSGMDYLSLTANEIVAVSISDCSYSGNIKPSSEKGIHAEVYKLYPEINFVIHTHQENASVISACGLESIKLANCPSCLGNEVICASYALPGTKKLRSNVSTALSQSSGKAVIMKNHGALCFGKNYEETFLVASELEKACQNFIANQYLKLSGRVMIDINEMNCYAIPPLSITTDKATDSTFKPFYNSRRTDMGFVLYDDHSNEIEVKLNTINSSLPKEAEIYNAIYNRYNNINYIIHTITPEIKALSQSGLKLKPLLDDFAQIGGTMIKNVTLDSSKILSALKNSSVIFIQDNGALCCGKTKDDAIAVAMVTQKASKALIGASLFGKIKPINPLECILMRFVYLKKYSKQKYKKS